MRRLIFAPSIVLAAALTALPALAQPAPPPPPPPAPSGQPAPPPPADPKPADPKPDAKPDAKPEDPKPGDAKPDEKKPDEKKPDEKKPGEGDSTDPKKDRFGEGDSPIDDLKAQPDGGVAKKDGAEWFIGARFRDYIVPHFIFALFASGGPDNVNALTGAIEAAMHNGNFELDLSAFYGDYSMKEFMFKNKKEPNPAFEVVSSDLKLFGFSVDLLGAIPFGPILKGTSKARALAVTLGGNVSIAGVAGNLYRNQAYPKDFNKVSESDSSQWVKCKDANDQAGVDMQHNSDYCDSSNDHYGSYSEPSWANGGSKPFLFPNLGINVGFRIRPHKILSMHIDSGFGLSGFFVGFGAGIRIPNGS